MPDLEAHPYKSSTSWMLLHVLICSTGIRGCFVKQKTSADVSHVPLLIPILTKHSLVLSSWCDVTTLWRVLCSQDAKAHRSFSETFPENFFLIQRVKKCRKALMMFCGALAAFKKWVEELIQAQSYKYLLQRRNEIDPESPFSGNTEC